MSKSPWSDEELDRRVKGLYRYRRVEVPKRPVQQRRRDFEETALGYSVEEARVEAERCMQCQDPPCVKACPAHLDVPGYCRAIAEGEFERGLQLIVDTFPLPGSCGRVCYQPCADVCLKGVEGQAIEIARLRRFLADQVDQHKLDYRIPPPTGRRVALIGSGPAGLTCAYHLVRRGHAAVVFERSAQPGGTLNTIPDYRLPKAVLQDEIALLRELGVEIRLNSPVEGEGCLDRLLEEYDAVFIGAGAVGSKAPALEGIELEGVITGYEFLNAIAFGAEVPLGPRVAVVGGGDVAMDAARTCLRLAEEVHLVYRRSAEEMTTDRLEALELSEEASAQDLHREQMQAAQRRRWAAIEEVFREPSPLTMEKMAEIESQVSRALKRDAFEQLSGAERNTRLAELTVHFLAQPVRVLGRQHVEGLECVRVELGPPDADGRRSPQPVAGSEFSLEVDTVIFATGQHIESSWLGAGSGLELDRWGRILVDERMQTSRSGVFAGGDAARGPVNMIQAIADGKRAAEAMDAHFASGGSRGRGRDRDETRSHKGRGALR